MATAPATLYLVDPEVLQQARKDVKHVREAARRADRSLAQLEEDFLARLGIKLEYAQQEGAPQ